MKIPKQRKLAMSAEYLLNELRVRYSHMIHEVNALPYAETTPIPMVIQLCAKTLEELFSHPEISPLHTTESTVSSFGNLLQRSLERHKNEKLLLAQGLFEWKHHNPSLYNEMNTKMIDRGLDAYLTHRIATTLLSEQHLALQSETENDSDEYVGIISKKCSPAKIARDVALDVQELIRYQLAETPKIVVLGNVSLTFSYIPVHIYYILIELVKNSAVAAIRTHGVSSQIPPIKVIVAQGKEDFCIKVEDEGGGISRTKIDQIWSYAFTTEQSESVYSDSRQTVLSVHDPVAGFGFGLPLSRLYARYFGGDLKLVSLDGYGTDSYIFLPRLGNVQALVPGQREFSEGFLDE